MALKLSSLLHYTCGIVSDLGCFIPHLTDYNYRHLTLQRLKIRFKKRPVINGSFSKDKIGESNSIQQSKGSN